MHKINDDDVLFIINPYSGKGNYKKIVKSIKALGQFNVEVTKSVSEIDRIFSNSKKFKVVVVVGGDGSVNEVLKRIINTPEKTMAILPNGSGNGFARELGFKKNVKSLIEDIRKGELLEIDIININSKPSVNVSGLGIDSYIAHEFSKTKNRGLINYIILSIKSVFTFRAFNAKLENEDRIVEGKFMLISFANTRQFGNNAIISPESLPNDGIYNIILVKPMAFYLYPVFAFKMMTGRLKESKYVLQIKTKHPTTVNSDFKKIHIDGDPYEFKDELKVSLDNRKIPIIKTKSFKPGK